MSLNLSKGSLPPVALPLCAQMLNISPDINFNKLQARYSWLYNAVTNTFIMAKCLHLNLSHDQQTFKWMQWSMKTRQTVLETLRTGTQAPGVQRSSDLRKQNCLLLVTNRLKIALAPRRRLSAHSCLPYPRLSCHHLLAPTLR